MNEMTIKFNGQYYNVTYNSQTGYYEIDLQAPINGGIYNTEISFTDLFGESYEDVKAIQVFAKEKPKFELNKIFMWIFSYDDFSVKNIVELSDYDINIDEETNANTVIDILKRTNAKAKDIVVIKKNNEVVYLGTIQEIQNEDGKLKFEFIIKYITNLFDRNIQLEDENLIRTTGIEDFIANAITKNFISSEDIFINKNYLQVNVLTHTPKQASVTNVENGIYNLHTYMTNCTQNYDIVYSFSIVNKKLVITIENKLIEKELIDVKAQAISNYTEVFETDVVSKVTVLYDKVAGAENKGKYTLYLLNDKNTTTDMSDVNRADGRIETIYTENYEDARQTALDVMKSNSYNHNITFCLYDKYIKVGTPIAIKTKESVILDTYISAVRIKNKKFYEYTCGNIRVKFIDKLLKERRN